MNLQTPLLDHPEPFVAVLVVCPKLEKAVAINMWHLFGLVISAKCLARNTNCMHSDVLALSIEADLYWFVLKLIWQRLAAAANLALAPT